MTTTLRRRRFLGLAGGSAAVALAGCLSGAGGQSPTEEDHADDHTDVPTDDHADHGDDDHHDGGTPTHHDDEHTHGEITGPHGSGSVRMISTSTGEHFDPHVVWVEAGGTVTWTNESGAHSVAAYAPDNDKPRRIPEGAASFDSGLLTEAGAEFSVTFEEPGVYDYYCAPHETIGMIGSVIVGEPDPHDQPGLAEPQAGMADPVAEKLHRLNEMVNEALGHTH